MTSIRDRQSFSSTPSFISVLLFLPGCTQALPSIWDVHISNEPTEATRNHPLLGVELGAIFGSYLIFLIFICIGILTVGRRLRRASQASPSTLGMDIIKPVQPVHLQPSTINPWGPSPISPAKSTEHQWPSPKPAGGWGSIKSKHAHKASLQSSVITFDESVIEEDKTKNEFEMDRLYAAVAEHDAEQTKKHSQVSARSINPPLSPLQQHPPELQHLRNGRALIPEQYPISPPPESDQYSYRQNTTSPGRTSTRSPRRMNKPSPIMVADAHSRNSSRSSFTSYGRKQGSIRGLPISPPMGSPDFNPENTQHYGDTEPLTPRYYNLPPPPPTPPQRNEPLGSPQAGDVERRFHFAPSIRSSRNSVASTYASPSQTPRTATFPIAPPPAIAEEQTSRTTHIAGGFNFALDPAPSSGSSTPRSTATAKTSKSKSKPAPLSLTKATSGSQTSLSLRTAPLPFRSLLSPRSQRAPASDIRATELTRPDKNRLMAPGSAVPATPYSPYMPQTPLTPMTPSRLVTREERKRMKKEQGRRVLTAEDAVPEEDDMWGDGY